MEGRDRKVPVRVRVRTSRLRPGGDILAELQVSLGRAKRLMDACDAWLQDADNPDAYDIGPRAREVIVTYREADAEGREVRHKATLESLITRVELAGGRAVERAETRIADPRELILKTTGEVRQTMALAVKLAQMLVDAEAIAAFEDSLLDEIAKVSEEVAANIKRAVRRRILMRLPDAETRARSGGKS